ncbi:ABC transporter ATP-binding protein [Phyllobacterium sp. 0TCS1.6C]|uniref:ABC transporter ATP-binding protein n=1 Tax=unclassified Phyllobacterium TaxID=2638441 RepID=UPI00226429CF|nr:MULTISPECIES: ABC transporter ATP-binding protein [unclassified Phyllobacterium]MCX8279228.1 ABC transporter ATP-binding protein [Phyllobacterium sp. 0TCS1.6C]MCX8294012.1 ABC transporter ATP-binding protein [Phyllobacterium sp. 0TCS1.6A]
MVTTINLNNVEKRYGTHEVIRGIDLKIKPGAFTVFVGPSGCGKSTLLRMIAGLETISDGDLLIDGERMNDVAASKRGIAMVFQSYALYPHMTVYKNLAFGLETAGYKRDEIDRRVHAAAATLQITDYLQRKPKALSGGQRQRVAIGRSIVRDPRIFLFDEPLSNLDAELRVQMRVEITKLHERLGNTMIYVTHDQVEAMTMADQIVVLRAGKVMQAGSPLELYNNPANQFVAGFIGSPKMNFITVQIADNTGILLNGMRIEACRQVKGEQLTLGVRPEHLEIGEGPGQSIGDAYVELVEHLGGSTVLHVRPSFQADTMTVVLAGQLSCRPGDIVPLRLGTANCHFFDTEGNTVPR